MLKKLSPHFTICTINAAIHWAVFSVGVYVFSVNQAAANLLAFGTAVSFFFFANAVFTFNAKPKTKEYFLFVASMGFMSVLVGKVSDYLQIEPVVTLIEFTLIIFVVWIFCYRLSIFTERS